LSWTKYQGWVEGVEEYIVEFQNEYGSYTEIGRTNPQDTFFLDEVSPFNCIESYCYRITAIRNQPDNYPDSTHSVISHSNVDCAPVESKIFIPNAFTINSDGLNENFTIKGIYIKEYNIKIFNRWGEKVYDSNSFKTHWDGTFNGQNVSQNVFIYTITAKGVDDKIYHLSGDVTLLK
jgi:gliding motility-associated-like protein